MGLISMKETIMKLKKEDEFFDKSFNDLKDFYKFNNYFKVYEFIKEFPQLIIVLKNMENSLKSKFPYGEFELSIDRDFETSEESLIVDIKVDEYTFDNGVMESIHEINSRYRTLKQKLGVVSKIFLMPAMFSYD